MTHTVQAQTAAAIQRFTAAVESERLRSSFIETLEDEPFTRFTEWAESLTTVADAIDTARDAIEQWRDAEERDDKSAAKDDAIAALDDLVTAWNDSPLDRLDARR